MKTSLSLGALAALALLACETQAAALTRPNYVVFNVKGDCNQEDCIALLKGQLRSQTDIVFLDATSLAPHDTIDYKTVIMTFKDLKTAPYVPVMEKIASLGYNIVSYVIHDTHTGQDVIIPH